jgi:hypothetical protein
MEFDDAVAQVRSWCETTVEVVLEPDHSVMSGRLYEVDSTGLDGALFAVDHHERSTTGIAVALFRDAFAAASLQDGRLLVEQGRNEITVRQLGGTEARSPDR